MKKVKLDLSTVYDVESPPFKQCPYCGGFEYHIKMQYSGRGIYRYNYDGSDADNSEMYSGVGTKVVSKYAFCSDCGAKLFRIAPKTTESGGK